MISKKKNNNDKGAKSTSSDIIDEKKDPCLRALQKKVRNITKKLNDITQLEKKPKDLNPEQIQKISKKQQCFNQKQKIQEFIIFYQGVLKDNQRAIREFQVAEVTDLGSVLAAVEYGAQIGLKSKSEVSNIKKILIQPSTARMTLKQRQRQLQELFVSIVDSDKIKKQGKQFIAENQLITLEEQSKIQPKQGLLGAQGKQPLYEEVQPQTKEIKKTHQVQIHGKSEPEFLGERVKVEERIQGCKPAAQIHPNSNNKVIQQKLKVQQTDNKPQEAKVEEGKVEVGKAEGAKAEGAKAEGAKAEGAKAEGAKAEGAKAEGAKADGVQIERINQQNRNYDKRPRQRKYQAQREPKQPKKRYMPKQAVQGNKKPKSNSSSLSSTPSVRQFKGFEKKLLVNDGFTIVAKKKPQKAREQKDYYDKEHGRKYHYHNQEPQK